MKGSSEGTPVAGISERRRNSFGLLRLVLASLVVVQHALVLTDHEPQALLGFWRPASVGDIAVAGFFGLSGFLLLSSTVRHSPRRFLRLRFHRLFPGFWATLLVVAFGVAPVVALVTGEAYPVVGSDSAVSYVLLNSSLVVLQDGIGDLLNGNPYPDALDGSLWSLAPEFLCYLVLLGGALLARRFGRHPTVVVAVLAAGSVLVHTVADPLIGGGIGSALSLLGSLGAAFFAGATLACTGTLAHTSRGRAALLAVAVAVAVAVGLWAPIGPPLLAAAVIAIGLSLDRGWTTRVDHRADLSYGMYLYHFPVIQVILAVYGGGLTAAAALGILAPLALVLTVPLAAASWFVVEAPALRRGRRHRLDTEAPTTRTGRHP